MKIMVMCQGGASRSNAMAYMLKKYYHHDALACAYRDNSAETIRMLCSWADLIIVMQAHMSQFIPAEFHDRLEIADVGKDRWPRPDRELRVLCNELWQQIAERRKINGPG